MLLAVSLFCLALLAALTVVTVAWLDERKLRRRLQAELQRHADDDVRLLEIFAPLTRPLPKLRVIEGGAREDEAS